MKPRETVVIVLGNPISPDDRVAPCVAAELQDGMNGGGPAIVEAAGGGLNLIDLLVRFYRAIFIDSIQTANGTPGQISSGQTERSTADYRQLPCNGFMLLRPRVQTSSRARIINLGKCSNGR